MQDIRPWWRPLEIGDFPLELADGGRDVNGSRVFDMRHAAASGDESGVLSVALSPGFVGGGVST
jgi:hypothetical protein